jgi:hypothetical protein
MRAFAKGSLTIRGNNDLRLIGGVPGPGTMKNWKTMIYLVPFIVTCTSVYVSRCIFHMCYELIYALSDFYM